jgi:capsular exopolysaccharide synthesis family protein
MSTPLTQFQLEDTARLREYLNVIRVRKWSVIAIVLVAAVVGLFYVVTQPNVYTSTAEVQLSNPIAAFLPVTTSATALNTATEEELVVSTPVTRCAHLIYVRPKAKDLSTLCSDQALAGASFGDWFVEDVTTGVPTLTSVLDINFTHEKPSVAQKAAQAYADAYVNFKTQQALDYVDNLRQPLLALERSLNQQIAQVTNAVNQDIATADQAAFQRDQAQLTNLQSQLAATQEQVVNADPAKITPPTVVVDAALPDSPSNTLFKILVLLVGVLVGLTIGIGQAFLRHRLDDRLRGRADLEHRLGVPVLAIVPHLRSWRRRKTTHLVTIEKRWSPSAEAYRALRTSILFTASLDGTKAILVTSPGEGEGKTTTAANIAIVLAEAGRRVILVSADLRKPRLGRFFHLGEQATGVTSVLDGEAELEDALQETGVAGLQLLSSGPIPGRPTEMILSEPFERLMEDLRARAEFVILDTTPLLVVADAMELSRLVDKILVVTDSVHTSRAAVSSSRKELAQLETSVLGAVMNNFSASKTVEYGEYSHRRYRYGYRRRREIDTSLNGEGGRAEEVGKHEAGTRQGGGSSGT